MSSIDPEASTSSAYILQPGRPQATATSDSIDDQASSTSEAFASATGFEASSAQATAPAHEHNGSDGDNSIEEVLHLLVEDVQSANA